MDHNILGIGIMIRKMEKEYKNGLIHQLIKVNIKIIKKMGKENIVGKMDQYILANGKWIK